MLNVFYQVNAIHHTSMLFDQNVDTSLAGKRISFQFSVVSLLVYLIVIKNKPCQVRL